MQPHNTAQPGQHGPADEVLLSEVRQGKLGSFGVLYERYVSMARAIAYRHTENGALVDDLVSEAFARILQTLKNGKGPRAFMGGYLATTIAHLAAENGLIAQKEIPTEQYQLESFGSLDETVLKLHESDELISAFTGLPERWQSILWMTEIENKKPREVAAVMNLSANAVSALAARARESLREGFLRAHQHAPQTVECSQHAPHLSSMVRGSLTKKRSEALRAHLSTCSACSAEYLTLIGVNQSMRTWVFPVLAGLTPILTDSSSVVLPYLTGGGLVTTGASYGGFSGFVAPEPGRWSTGNQSLIGAAAVVTAIGAVAGGIALVNNSVPNSAVISADSQLEAAPVSNTTEDTGAVTDTLIDSSHNVTPNRPVSAFRVPLAPAPMAPFAGETFDSSMTGEGESNRLPLWGHIHSKGLDRSSQEGDSRANGKVAGLGVVNGLTLGQSLSLFSTSPAQGAAVVNREAPSSGPTSSGQPVSPVSPGASGGAHSPVPQPTNPVNNPTDRLVPAQPVTPKVPVSPVTPPESSTPTAPAKPVTPTPPDTPSEPGRTTAPAEPIISDPFEWVGTPEYYDWMARVPWDTIGRPVGGNRMCTVTYIELGLPMSFGTYIPPIILDSPYAFYVLESHYGLREIVEIECY